MDLADARRKVHQTAGLRVDCSRCCGFQSTGGNVSHALVLQLHSKGRDGKAPLINAWQNFPGASVQQLSRWPGIKSIGVITGPSLLCFDFDGLSAIEKVINVYGLDPDEIRTWRIDRDNDDNRLKMLFRPTRILVALIDLFRTMN